MRKLFLLCGLIMLMISTGRAREEYIYDRDLGMRAQVVQVPEGWQFEGNLVHMTTSKTNLTFRVVDPRSGAWFQRYYDQHFCNVQGQATFPLNFGNLKMVPPMPANEVLQKMIGESGVKNIEVLESGRNEKIMQFLRQMVGQGNQILGQVNRQGYQAAMNADHYYSVIVYQLPDGRRVKDTICIVVMYNQVQMAIPGMFQITAVDWVVTPFSIGIPADLPEEQVKMVEQAMAALMNYQATPEWNQRIQQIIMAENQRQNDQAQAMIRTQQQIAESSRQVFNDRNAAQSKALDGWSDVIMGLDRVTNPISGNEMKIDTNAKHAWVNPGGEVLYTNGPWDRPNSGGFVQIR